MNIKFKPCKCFKTCKFLYFIFIAISCKPTGNDTPAPSGNYSHGVWIINEGLYNSGNASLSFLHTGADTLENDVFYNTNKRPLGDVFQSMLHYNNQYFLALNNSQKIEVTDDKTLKTTHVIDQLTSPRYFLPVSDVKAYATDLYSKGISIIDLKTMKSTGQISYNPQVKTDFASWTEEMVLNGTDVFITAVKTGKLLVVNTISDKITDTIDLGIGAKSIVKDKDNRLWVLCDGTLAIPTVASELFCINPVTRKIVNRFALPPKQDTGAGHLQINADGDSLFYVYGSIYKMGIQQAALSPKSFIPGNGHNFYGLGIDPKTNAIYVADALDNVQKGFIFRYNTNGKLLKTFRAGVGPNGFLFMN